MGLTVKEGAKVDPVPEGVHHGVCFGVVDLGTQPPMPNSRYPGRSTPKLLIMFELPDERMTFERDGVQIEGPRVISKDFSKFLSEKAGLRKFLESWRGRKFSDEERAGFNVGKLLRANCMLNIVHNERGYADIASVSPLPKAMLEKRRQPELPTVLFDLDEYDGGPFPPSLPKWVVDRIVRCEEIAARDHSADGFGGDPPPHQDDDIPF